MMDCPTTTMEQTQNFQPKEEEEQQQQQQENCSRTESLYLHLLSPFPEGKISVFYKIDSSGDDEANFNQKPKLIPLKIPKNLPHIGFGTAICDSILYLFGGWVDHCLNWRKEACYLDLVAASCNNNKEESSSLRPVQHIKHEMNGFRAFPITVTIGKKIYIFGSQNPGCGEYVRQIEPTTWAEVFNTEDKLFKLISPPPFNFSSKPRRRSRIGVAALIENNSSKILLATNDFSDLFIYDVETDQWTHTPRDTVSPFRLCSMRSPVIDKYIFLYGNGKICAFDMEKNQFLKNNISLLEYSFFDDDDEKAILNGVIHHRGGWKFSVVFGDEGGYLVRFVYIVSFEIENPECCGGELNVKAGTINIVDHVVRGDSFVDSLLWSNQKVPSGNPSNGKQLLKSNLIVGGSSVTSHVDAGCMMDDYGATSRPDLPKLRRQVAVLSKLRRKEAALDKEMFEMRLKKNYLIAEISKLKEKLSEGVYAHDIYLNKLGRLERELSSLTNMGEYCDKKENVSEIKTKCLLEEISNTMEKVEAQLIEREEVIHKIDQAQGLVRSFVI